MKAQRRGPRRRAPKPPRTPGERLWAAREHAGLTQAELGRRIGLGQAAVSAWEKEESQPRESLWPLLEKALGQSRRALQEGIDFRLPEEGRVAEGMGAAPLDLPPWPPGAQVVQLASLGLAQEALSESSAVKRLREAIRGGRPVWLILG